ncbi:MAG: hypothetical protein U0Y68_17720 [Blastocatellia bacterium]
MKKFFPRLLLTSLLFLAIPSLAQAVGGTETSQYLAMDKKSQDGFIASYASNFGWMLSPEKPLIISASGIQLIKKWVDIYAKRVGTSNPQTGTEDLRKVFERGVQYAPVINEVFEKEKVLETFGITLALLETEFQPCPAKAKGKGMFAIVAPATPKGEDLCEVDKGAVAAAKLLKARIAEFGKDGTSVALAILSIKRGSAAVKRDFAVLIKEKDAGGGLWEILAEPDAKKFDKAFMDDGVNYLPKFIAAAIVAESPETFGLKAYPLSTYAPQKK